MSETTPRPAASGAKDQVARLLTLVPYLHARDSVRLDEAAVALGVSPHQLLKDLKVLLMCGLPGGYPDDLIDVDLDALEDPGGDGVIRISNADYLARPLRLTPTEASAVIVALRALRNTPGQTKIYHSVLKILRCSDSKKLTRYVWPPLLKRRLGGVPPQGRTSFDSLC